MKDKKRSRDLDREDAINGVEEIKNVEDLNDFCEGETRKNILNAAMKRLLRLRGGVTCEDVLSNLRKKGYKV
jgi:hypothetical protein